MHDDSVPALDVSTGVFIHTVKADFTTAASLVVDGVATCNSPSASALKFSSLQSIEQLQIESLHCRCYNATSSFV